MEQKDIIVNISEVFMDVMKMDAFDENMDMNNIETWDSLSHINLIMELEKKFNLQFNYHDIVEMNSIRKILTIIQKYLL